jgi:F-type H+-transporting ATPase subunit a
MEQSIPEAGQTQAVHEGSVPEVAWLHDSMWQPTAMWGLTWLFIVLTLSVATYRMSKVPKGLQNAWEFLYEWLDTGARSIVAEETMVFFPLFISLFLYVFFCNLMGLIPGLASATSKTDTTLALAFVTFMATHFLAIRKKGLGHALHYFQVVDFRTGDNLMAKVILFVLQFFLLPVIEMVGTLAQPVSLAARLFGNIFAKETILAVLAALLVTQIESPSLAVKGLALMPFLLRPGIIVLGVLVSLIQAVVFTVLSMVYINNALESHAGGHEEHSARETEAVAH